MAGFSKPSLQSKHFIVNSSFKSCVRERQGFYVSREDLRFQRSENEGGHSEPQPFDKLRINSAQAKNPALQAAR